MQQLWAHGHSVASAQIVEALAARAQATAGLKDRNNSDFVVSPKQTYGLVDFKVRTSAKKSEVLELAIPSTAWRRTTKLGKVVAIVAMVIVVTMLASSQFYSRQYLSAGEVTVGGKTGHIVGRANEDTGHVLDIEPGLVANLTSQVKCVLVVLAIAGLLYSFRFRTIASRLRIAATSARLSERERIARELHDTLLQGVQGLMLRLQAVAERVKSEPEHAQQLLEEALVRVDAVLEEGRDRVQDLRAINNSPCDLSQTFLHFAEDAQPHPTKIRVTVEGATRELQPFVREEIVKIGVEAISNALRHAKASMIEVELLFQSRRFSLRISDDGIGIDSAILNAGRERHFGLTGIRERARGIPGRLSIASVCGGGTEIELVISSRIAYEASRQALSHYWRGRFSTSSKIS